MLVLNRRVNQGVYIDLQPTVDPTITAQQLFADGPITVVILETEINSCRVGIHAPEDFRVLRAELRARNR